MMVLMLWACSQDFGIAGRAPAVADPPAVVTEDLETLYPTSDASTVPVRELSPEVRRLRRVLDVELPVAQPASTASGAPSPSGAPDALRPAALDPRSSSARGAWQTPDGRVRRERHEVGPGATTPIADFLFVLDPSVSMVPVMAQVNAAFSELARSEAFPLGARVGVISTTPADPQAPWMPHPAVRYGDLPMDIEPGFQRLVSARSIERFRAALPLEEKVFYEQRGCEDWFEPGATDVHNVPCLVGATQTPLAPVGVEAGLTALVQWIEASGPEPRFREGATVHVIFVSDTHDPGVAPIHPDHPALVALRPSVDQVLAAVEQDQVVADVRLHGIVPLSSCGERQGRSDRSYVRPVTLTGGELLDVCTATSYVPFVRALATKGGQVGRPVISLGTEATGPVEVRVDQRAAAFSLTASGSVLVLDGALPKQRAVVDVAFEPRRAGRR